MKLNEISMYDNIFKNLNIDNITEFKSIFKQGVLFDYLDYLYDDYIKNETKILNVLNFIYQDSRYGIERHKLYKEMFVKMDKYFFDKFRKTSHWMTGELSYDILKVLYLILPFDMYYGFIEKAFKQKMFIAKNIMAILLQGDILTNIMTENERNKIIDVFFSDYNIYSVFFTLYHDDNIFNTWYKISKITTNQTLKDVLKSFEKISLVSQSKDIITNDIMLVLEKMERNNRIKKVLWNGESRIKGNIYPDTIQQMIDNVTKGSMKYSEPVEVTIPSKEITLPDGTKIMTKPKTQLQGKKLLPMDADTQKQIDILKVLLTKSQQKNHVKNTEKIDISISDDRIERIKQYILKSKVYAIVERSKYTDTTMQTLLTRDYQNHKVMLFYIKNFNMKSFSKMFDINTDEMELENHQGSDRKDLMLGFIRYHIFDDKIFINTIQTDIGGYIYSGKYKRDERNGELYQYICKRIMQYFIKYQHQKGVTQLVLPNTIMRQNIFDSDGVPSIYDDLPKKMGFEKIKFKDTIWYDKSQALSNSDMKIDIRQGDFNAWILQGLNESLIKR